MANQMYRVCEMFFILSLLSLLSTCVQTRSAINSTSVVDHLLDFLALYHPNPVDPFASLPETSPKSTPVSSDSPPSTNDEDLELKVYIPNDPQDRYITVTVRTDTDIHLAPAQIENCIVALNGFVQQWMDRSSQHGATVIPESAYPIAMAPAQAQGAFIEIEDEGQDGGMRLETLQLTLRGLFGLLVIQRRPFEANFEIRCVEFPPVTLLCPENLDCSFIRYTLANG